MQNRVQIKIGKRLPQEYIIPLRMFRFLLMKTSSDTYMFHQMLMKLLHDSVNQRRITHHILHLQEQRGIEAMSLLFCDFVDLLLKFSLRCQQIHLCVIDIFSISCSDTITGSLIRNHRFCESSDCGIRFIFRHLNHIA